MWPIAQDLFHFRTGLVERFQPPLFPVFTADVGRTGWYGFPAKTDGTIKIANHGPGRRIDPSGERVVQADSEVKFRRFFADTFPDLAPAPKIYERVCFYCDTFDGDFWIDRDPQHEGLVVASGGSGHAFKFAPVIGPLIADVVEGLNPAAARTAWRDPNAQDRRRALRG
jgi:glycine/D-amino acid oxidase-like deaminating enzyme